MASFKTGYNTEWAMISPSSKYWTCYPYILISTVIHNCKYNRGTSFSISNDGKLLLVQMDMIQYLFGVMIKNNHSFIFTYNDSNKIKMLAIDSSNNYLIVSGYT